MSTLPAVRTDGWQAEHVGVTTADGEQPSEKPRWTWSRELHEANKRGGVEVLPERTLDELAEIANREHAAAVEDAHSALQHALASGAAIWEAHERFAGDGPRWNAWVAANLRMSVSYVELWERYFVYRDVLPREAAEPFRDARGNLQQPSFKRVRVYLAGLPPIRHRGRPGAPPEVRDEAIALHKSGLSAREIASLLGFNKTTIQKWVSPEAARKARAHSRRSAAKARAARQALRRQQDAAAARKMSGRISDILSWTRKSLEIAGKEALDAEAGELRRELNALSHDLYRVEDRLARIIGMGKQ